MAFEQDLKKCGQDVDTLNRGVVKSLDGKSVQEIIKHWEELGILVPFCF